MGQSIGPYLLVLIYQYGSTDFCETVTETPALVLGRGNVPRVDGREPDGKRQHI